jgi:hypothetical protein
MSDRLAELTTRRRALQARCALQRHDVQTLYAGIEDRTARVDRVLGVARSLTPLVAVGGVAVLLVMGPQRALLLVRRGLAVALYAVQARGMFGR